MAVLLINIVLTLAAVIGVSLATFGAVRRSLPMIVSAAIIAAGTVGFAVSAVALS